MTLVLHCNSWIFGTPADANLHITLISITYECAPHSAHQFLHSASLSNHTNVRPNTSRETGVLDGGFLQDNIKCDVACFLALSFRRIRPRPLTNFWQSPCTLSWNTRSFPMIIQDITTTFNWYESSYLSFFTALMNTFLTHLCKLYQKMLSKFYCETSNNTILLRTSWSSILMKVLDPETSDTSGNGCAANGIFSGFPDVFDQYFGPVNLSVPDPLDDHFHGKLIFIPSIQSARDVFTYGSESLSLQLVWKPLLSRTPLLIFSKLCVSRRSYLLTIFVRHKIQTWLFLSNRLDCPRQELCRKNNWDNCLTRHWSEAFRINKQHYSKTLSIFIR